MYWLAEQGLAPKRVLLVVLPLILIFLIEKLKYVLKRKEGKTIMVRTKNTFDARMFSLDCFSGLSGNIAGGALLANTLYDD